VLRQRFLVSVLLATAGCGRGPFPNTWELAPGSPTDATSGMVSSSHQLASDVGAGVLARGGNAVDAAVAVGFALAVVHPEAGNIGGGGYMVIRLGGVVTTLDYRETAPEGARRDMFLDSLGAVTEAGVTGHLAAGVPGSVAGMVEAHRRYGALPLPDVLAPAVALARDGFEIDGYRARSLARAATRLAQFEGSRAQFLPNGAAPPEGSRFTQPDLARTLQAIADSGDRVFYEGYIADLIAQEMARGHGIMTKPDLAAYRPVWREPIQFQYRGYTIYSMAPSSSGGVTLAIILNVLEGYDALPPQGSPQQIHLMAESMRRAYTDRNEYLGDPAFVDMPVERLISDEYALARGSDIDLDRATSPADVPSGISEGDHTTHYSVVDAAGNAVAVTTTINSGYGSAVTVTGAGFLLNNEMDDFTSAPGQPNIYGLVQGEANAIESGKRMLSSMTPTLVLDPAGELMLVLGSPGGATIISTLAQVISNVVDHGMRLPQAIRAPRVHHQGQPDTLFYEPGGLRGAAVAMLEAMGHATSERSDYSGEVNAIEVRAGHHVGVADPRRGGGASGH